MSAGRRRVVGSGWSLPLVAATLLVAACGAPEKVVRIAVAIPLTGDLGGEGRGLRRAVELAVEEVDAVGRLPFRVETVAFDDRADPDEADNVAHLIVADPRIVAVVGHYSSDCSARAARVYAQGPLAMVTPASTHPEITLQQLRPDWRGARVAFRLVPTDDVQGEFSAEFVRWRLRKKRMAVAHDGTLYGQGLAEEFRRTFVRLGGRVCGEAVVPVGSRQVRAPLLALKAGSPEGIFFGGRYPEAGLLLREMRRMGMRLPFVSGDGSRTPALFDVAGEAADGAYASMAGVPVELLPEAKAFVDAYGRRWRGADEGLRPFDHFGYEAARVVLAALAEAGPDRSRLLDAIRKRRHIGLLGMTAFDEKGDVRSKRVAMTRARAADRSFPVVE